MENERGIPTASLFSGVVISRPPKDHTSPVSPAQQPRSILLALRSIFSLPSSPSGMGCGASHGAASQGPAPPPIPTFDGSDSTPAQAGEAETGESNEVFVFDSTTKGYTAVLDDGSELNKKPSRDASESDSLLVRIHQT